MSDPIVNSLKEAIMDYVNHTMEKFDSVQEVIDGLEKTIDDESNK